MPVVHNLEHASESLGRLTKHRLLGPTLQVSEPVDLMLLVPGPHFENKYFKLPPIAQFMSPLPGSPITTLGCIFLYFQVFLLLDSWLSKGKGHKFSSMCQNPRSINIYIGN